MPQPEYPYPPPHDPTGHAPPPDPGEYEPRSFADVLMEELEVIRRRREVIYGRSRVSNRLDRAKMAAEPVRDPSTLLGAERQRFRAERRAANEPDDEDSYLAHARVRALDQNVAGLAFSGGGIRSATFAVGFLQGLAGLRLLRFFDVLSTVSGGGYAGAWLATWMRREGDPINVEHQLDPGRVGQRPAVRGPRFVAAGDASDARIDQVVEEEPEPIRHLRRYSSYLNPRPGLLSADTWTVVAIYFRNVLINLLVLLPIIVTLVLLVRLLFCLYAEVALNGDPACYLALFALGVLATLVGLVLNAVSLLHLDDPPDGHWIRRGWVCYVEVGLLLLGAVLLSMTYQPVLDLLRALLSRVIPGWDPSQGNYLGRANVLGHAALFGLLALVATLCFYVKPATANLGKALGGDSSGWWYLLGALIDLVAGTMGGATMGVLVTLTEEVLRPAVVGHSAAILALVGPPLLLVDLVVAMAALVALSGFVAPEPEREWWARVAALLLMSAGGWLAFVGVVLYGPLIFLGSRQIVVAALASGWVGITAAGVRAGRSASTSTGGAGRGVELLAVLAPPVFLVGLLAAVSTAVVLLVDPVARVAVQPSFGRAAAAYLYAVQRAHGPALAGLLLVAAVATALGLVLVNVNLFSLHAMYANRLTRAFLGASLRRPDWRDRWEERARAPWSGPFRDQRALAGAPTGVVQGGLRNPNPVTQFDPDDDLDLAELAPGAGDDRARYWGPLVIFNTALNLVGGRELAWRDRKAESFALTPLFSGAKTTGYARTSAETRRQLTVGRAMAISGAAVDPNMNFHQSAPVTALLTVFNARLGVWIQNPNRDHWPPRWGPLKPPRPWSARGASFGSLLVKEILGLTSQNERFVHLSDGGHFDNLGVYELVKRRCRYIVAVDATEDPADASDNLGTLVRLCRVDFGIRIQLDTAPLKVEGPDGYSRAHVVVGRVRYDDVDHGQTPGILVYVKSTMTGDEPPDVRQYAKLHPEFPRQLTLTDQSFDEDQFESYRALGAHTAASAFGIAQNALLGRAGSIEAWFDGYSNAADAFAEGQRKVFSALRNRWSEPPVVRDADRIESSRAWVGFQGALRTDPDLAEIARDFYSDLPSLRDPAAGRRRRAELHMMEQALQLMGDTWEGLGLRGSDEAPINRGWMNTFRRVSGSEAFRRYWPLLRSEFSADFVRFCERQLGARVADPVLIRAADRPDLVAHLGAELAREWPELVGRDEVHSESLAEAGARYLRDQVVGRAILLGSVPPTTPAAWVVAQYPVEFEKSRDPDFEVPLGLLAMTPDARAGDGYELFLWITRAQRSSGLGEKIRKSKETQLMIAQVSRARATVRVRYPGMPVVGGEDLNRIRWLSFFSLFGFKPEGRPGPGGPWVLSRKYP